ncbi:MAG: methylated-DNA--[protein]-cysteine S-methyltransferase [Candidatus Cloacimonetes bacterium]|nr:methylated-DNA--[protein]-cysteine S-methyltransferase [Candidatus Cloacimonadota bacterium]
MKRLFESFPTNAKYCFYQTKVNQLLLVACDDYLRAILHSSNYEMDDFLSYGLKEDGSNTILSKTSLQLDQYVSGDRTEFDIPMFLEGTEFQQSAWKALTTIEYGKTISYQDQAIRLGDAKKCRAVGMANGKNPISIIVPCHRVIAKNGNLQGYGGGLDMKQYLLDLEKADCAI